jgi:hypothetical protein
MRKVVLLLFSVILSGCSWYSHWATLNYSSESGVKSSELNPVVELESLAKVKINTNEVEEISDLNKCKGSWKALNFKIWPYKHLRLDIESSKVHDGASEIGMRYVKSFRNAKLSESGQIELVKFDSSTHEGANWFQLALATSVNCNSSFEMELVFLSDSGERNTRELFFYPHQYRQLDR